jgi:hypothetical protein
MTTRNASRTRGDSQARIPDDLRDILALSAGHKVVNLCEEIQMDNIGWFESSLERFREIGPELSKYLNMFTAIEGGMVEIDAATLSDLAANVIETVEYELGESTTARDYPEMERRTKQLQALEALIGTDTTA